MDSMALLVALGSGSEQLVQQLELPFARIGGNVLWVEIANARKHNTNEIPSIPQR